MKQGSKERQIHDDDDDDDADEQEDEEEDHGLDDDDDDDDADDDDDDDDSSDDDDDDANDNGKGSDNLLCLVYRDDAFERVNAQGPKLEDLFTLCKNYTPVLCKKTFASETCFLLPEDLLRCYSSTPILCEQDSCL